MGLELVEIVMEVEETFGVIVSDEAAPEIRTVEQLHATQQMTDAEVWARLPKIVADILGVKIESVMPSARFVEDLGAG